MLAYKIAEIGFGFNTSVQITESGFYRFFRIAENEFDSLENKHIFDVDGGSAPMPELGRKIFGCSAYSVFECDGGYSKVTDRFDSREFKCICSQSKTVPGGKIFFTEDGANSPKTDAELFRIIDFVSALLMFDAVILHASVVELGGKAFIFSGKSGAGKSTQAELWKEYNGASIKNGDRVILRKTEKGWRAYGLPMSGSSDYCELFELPAAVVIFLEKGSENAVECPADFEKFMLMTSQISCGARKADEADKLIDLVSDVSRSLKIIKYRCTPTPEAAEYLKNYLRESECHE